MSDVVRLLVAVAGIGLVANVVRLIRVPRSSREARYLAVWVVAGAGVCLAAVLAPLWPAIIVAVVLWLVYVRSLWRIIAGGRTFESQVQSTFPRLADEADPVPALIEALGSRDADAVRVAALWLGEHGAAQASGPLIRLLDDPEPALRRPAARALGALRAREAVPRLMQSVAEDPDTEVRLWAVRSLREIGDPTALPTALSALRDEAQDVRMVAASTVAELGTSSDLPALQAAAKREPHTAEWWARGRILYRAAERRLSAKSA